MATVDHNSDLDEIREASNLGMVKGAATAKLDRLLEMGWCDPKSLSTAFDALHSAEGVSVAVSFCQLSFEVRLPEIWIKSNDGMPTSSFVQFMPAPTLSDAGDPQPKKTQVLISIPIVGPEEILLPRYALAIADKLAGKYPNVPFHDMVVGESTVRKRPITVKECEKRLLEQTRASTRRILDSFLPIYSVACHDPGVPPVCEFESFVLMVPSGRLVSHSEQRTGAEPKKPSRQPQNTQKNIKLLNQYIASRRKPSIYEQYLLEAARQSEIGSAELAVVQTVMILEWFVNAMILEHVAKPIEKTLHGRPLLRDLVLEELSMKLPGGKAEGRRGSRSANEQGGREQPRRGARLQDKFSRYLMAIGIDLSLRSELWNELIKLIGLRNVIVHRHAAPDLEREKAQWAVQTGFAVLDFCMSELLKRGQDT